MRTFTRVRQRQLSKSFLFIVDLAKVQDEKLIFVVMKDMNYPGFA